MFLFLRTLFTHQGMGRFVRNGTRTQGATMLFAGCGRIEILKLLAQINAASVVVGCFVVAAVWGRLCHFVKDGMQRFLGLLGNGNGSGSRSRSRFGLGWLFASLLGLFLLIGRCRCSCRCRSSSSSFYLCLLVCLFLVGEGCHADLVVVVVLVGSRLVGGLDKLKTIIQHGKLGVGKRLESLLRMLSGHGSSDGSGLTRTHCVV